MVSVLRFNYNYSVMDDNIKAGDKTGENEIGRPISVACGFPDPSTLVGRVYGMIFDLDGTLLDSMGVWTSADECFLAARGFRVTREYTDYVKSVSIDEAASYTRRLYAPDMTETQIIAEWHSFVDRKYHDEVLLKPGAGRYVRLARDLGFRIACATALTRDNAEAALRRCGILDCFDSLLTLGDIEGIRNKNEPDIYLLAASRLGTAPEATLVFEDIPAALTGARKGNFRTCAVYDSVGCPEDALWDDMCAQSDFHIRNWSDS